MHALQEFARKKISAGEWPQPAFGHRLSAVEAASAEACLRDDASGFLYSSCLSVCEAIRGIDVELFSWATTKLYYALFYGVRALLATRGSGLFYEGTKPRVLEAVDGAPIVQKAGTSHVAVLALFSERMSTHALLSQPIEMDPAPHWLMQRREDATYRQCGFSDPRAPDHFQRIVRMGIRSALETYESDDSLLYAFQPNHAMLAYPIAVLRECGRVAANMRSFGLDPDQRAFLHKNSRDASGPLPSLVRLFDQLTA